MNAIARSRPLLLRDAIHCLARWPLAALFLAAIFGSTAQAQTNITGSITTNTVWRASDGPFVLSGDVQIQNGAVLTIEAGAVLYMTAASALSVQAGALIVNGTPAQRVTITSQKIQLSQTPAKGDWAGLRFLAGAGQSRLSYVDIDFGSGIAVNGARLTLQGARLRSHLGAAVSIDLGASLDGGENEATGNDVNAVAVPPGDILGSVAWSLRGIPFLIGSGTVGVGAAPRINTVAPGNIAQGATRSVTVAGSRLRGAARPMLGAAGLTGTVLAGGTDSQLQLQLTATPATPLGATWLSLLTDAGEVRLESAVAVVGNQPVLSTLSPTSILVGQGAVQLTVTGENIDTQSVVLIDSVAVATVIVNSTQATATIANQIAAGTRQIQLRTPDPLNAGQFLLTAALPLIVNAPTLTLTSATTSVTRGLSLPLTVEIPYTAGPGGVVVSLASANPGVGTVPPSVTIAAGSTSSTFSFSALAAGSTIVTASSTGFTNAQRSLTVVPTAALSVSPPTSTVGIGRTVTLSISSSVVAGPGGQVVNLQSSAPSIATVAPTVTIPAGSSSTSAVVTAVAMGGTTVTASAAGYDPANALVNVRAVTLTLPATSVVAPGLTTVLPITLSDPAPVGGAIVAFASSNAAAVPVPADVVIAAGQTTGSVTITGGSVGASTLTASASGYQAGSSAVSVQNIGVLLGAASISLPEGQGRNLTLNLTRAAPTGGITVSLSSTAGATVSPSQIVIPEGEFISSTPVRVTAVTEGSATVTAGGPGLTPTNVNVLITPRPSLGFSRAQLNVGRNFTSHVLELSVVRFSGSSNFSGVEPVTIALTSSDPTKVSVPATVTIGLNQTVFVAVTGLELTGGTPVTISATATGYNSPAANLSVSVLPPTYSYCLIDTARSVISARDSIQLCNPLQPGTTNAEAPASNLSVDLSISDAAPAGVVSAFHSALTGGTPITSVSWNAGSLASGTFFVGAPTVPGSYRVSTAINGIARLSNPVTVYAAPDLAFNKTAVSVGRGLRTYFIELAINRRVAGTPVPLSEAVTVNMTSSDPSRATVPPTVTIPAGSSAATFAVTGVELTAGNPVTISASAVDYQSPPSSLSVSVVPAAFAVCEVDTYRVLVSPRDTAHICGSVQPGSAYADVAAANMMVDVTVVDANPVGIVAGIYAAPSGAAPPVTQISWLAGNSTSTNLYVGTPTSLGSYRVRASLAGQVADSSITTVVEPELRFSRTLLNVGRSFQTSLFELTLTRMAGGLPLVLNEPVNVTLTNTDPSKVGAVTSMTISGGFASTSVSAVRGLEFTSGTPVTISATAAGYRSPVAPLQVSVVNGVIRFCDVLTSREIGAARDEATVCAGVQPGSTQAEVPFGNWFLTLSLTNPTPPGIVAGFFDQATGGSPITQVFWGANTVSSAPFFVGSPTVNGTYRVSAFMTTGATALSDTVAVGGTSGPFRIKRHDLNTSYTVLGIGKGLRTGVPEIGIERTGSATTPLTVSVRCVSAVICRTSASTVFFQAGNTGLNNFTVEGLELGSTVIEAVGDGFTATYPVNVVPLNAFLPFPQFPYTVAIGAPHISYVFVFAPNAVFVQDALQPLDFDLTSNPTSIATIAPLRVTVPVGTYRSPDVTITGVSPGNATLTVSNPGMSAPQVQQLSVTP